MQHIVHIFIGEELVSLRDRFASVFRNLHKDIKNPYFTALTLTISDKLMNLSPDKDGDSLDTGEIALEKTNSDLYNYFQNMYQRKVTVHNRGNESLVVVLWAKLFLDDNRGIFKQLIGTLSKFSKINIEFCGFTDDSVSCFVPNYNDRLNPNIYKNNFKSNIEVLKELRSKLTSLRLVANVNMRGVALNFDEATMARVCAEYAAVMCYHYLVLRQNHIDSQAYPLESFGLSSIVFDRVYYTEYLKNKIFIDVIDKQNVKERRFLINNLAQVTNPILNKKRNELDGFYTTTVTNAKANLSVIQNLTATNVVANVDNGLDEVIKGLENDIDHLLKDENKSIFEKEAIISLILGDDCFMFESSAVNAHEIVIDDVIDKSARFFVDLDTDKRILSDVSQEEIKKVRTEMRNIAVAQRREKERLEQLSTTQADTTKVQIHIEGGKYKFEDKSYKLDLKIDSEPLEKKYQPHSVSVKSVDLRDLFGMVRDQGIQGSCAAFAISSVIEVLRRDKKQYSPAFLYWNAREIDEMTDVDSGASIYGVLKGAMDKGVCLEELMPYDTSDFRMRPSDKAYEGAKNCKVLDAQMVEVNIDAIKSALSDGFPVIVASKIFDSFSNNKKGFVPIPSEDEMSNETTGEHGHHALVLCGFSDNEHVLIARNSWGTSFGDKGYCYIPYSYAKRFFTQACIISAVSNSSNSENKNINKTLNFNMSDIETEISILRNLVAEYDYELMLMFAESDNLKSKWIKNIATLQNVNIQNSLVETKKNNIQENIDKEYEKIRELQSSKNDKINDFKKSYVLRFIFSLLTIMVSIVVLLLFASIITGAIFGVSILFLFYLIGRYTWAIKLYRQELNDEIQGHSIIVDRFKENKDSLDLKAHINGKIIVDVDGYKVRLRNKKNLISKFNKDIIELYGRTKEELNKMTPAEPYPFTGVLDNENLDRYYNIWSDKMTSAVNLNQMLSIYSLNDDIENMLNNEDVQREILRGIRDFGIKEYLIRKNERSWQFLPNTNNLSDVIKDLDSKAMPFCPYEASCPSAKYLLVKGMVSDDMNSVERYFRQRPTLISTEDPDTISVVNIEWYGYDQILAEL